MSARQPLGDRRLAVGAGDGDQRQAFGRLTEHGMGQRPAQHAQAADRQLGNAPGVVPDKIAAALPQYGAGPARDGVGNVAAAISLCAGPGDKQVAGSQLATVFTDPARLNAKCGSAWPA